MTLAVGCSPGDGSGAVLVTDALMQLRGPQGSSALLWMSPRFTPLPGAQGVAVVSGMTDAGWMPCVASQGLEAAVGELTVDLRRNLAQNAWSFVDGRQVEPRGEFIAAGLIGRYVAMVNASTWGDPQWAGGPTVMVAGAGRDIDVTVGPPPANLRACVVCALSLARTILQNAANQGGYRDLTDALERGEVPAMAPPFHVATVTARGIDIQRFDR